MPLNEWLKSHLEAVTDYFVELIDVQEPSEHLQVDKYVELTQKTKPVIIIALHEISQTHKFLQGNIEKLAKVNYYLFLLVWFVFFFLFIIDCMFSLCSFFLG
jgi:hypothetical protein